MSTWKKPPLKSILSFKKHNLLPIRVFFSLKEIKRIDGKETPLNEVYNFHKRDRKDLLLNLTQSLNMIIGLIYLSCLIVIINFWFNLI